MPPRDGFISRLVRLAGFNALLTISAPALPAGVPAEYTVVMSKMRYGTIPSTLKVGDTIIWVNRDTVPHTVTARNRSFDIRIAPRKQAKMTLTKPGKFAFYCVLHPAMRGTLEVAAN